MHQFDSIFIYIDVFDPHKICYYPGNPKFILRSVFSEVYFIIFIIIVAYNITTPSINISGLLFAHLSSHGVLLNTTSRTAVNSCTPLEKLN